MTTQPGQALRVAAPYVTMGIKQQTGGVTITGLYRDAVVQDADVDPVDRDRLLEKGMVEWIVEPKPEKAKPAAKEPEPEKAPDSPDAEPDKSAAKTGKGGG